MSSTPKLSLEIIARIFGHLSIERMSSIAACGLACKEWHPLTRHIVFGDVRLSASPSKIQSSFVFLKLIEASKVAASSVRCLQLSEYDASHYFVHWLSDLTKSLYEVQTLVLGRFGWKDSRHSMMKFAHKQLFLDGFRKVTNLSLEIMEFVSVDDIAELICSFPLLESLKLDSITFESPLLIANGGFYRLPRTLRSLDLGMCPKSQLINWVISDDMPPLTTVTLRTVTEYDAWHVECLLKEVSHSIQRLNIFYSSSKITSIDLFDKEFIQGIAYPNLTTVEFSFPHSSLRLCTPHLFLLVVEHLPSLEHMIFKAVQDPCPIYLYQPHTEFHTDDEIAHKLVPAALKDGLESWRAFDQILDRSIGTARYQHLFVPERSMVTWTMGREEEDVFCGSWTVDPAVRGKGACSTVFNGGGKKQKSKVVVEAATCAVHAGKRIFSIREDEDIPSCSCT